MLILEQVQEDSFFASAPGIGATGTGNGFTALAACKGEAAGAEAGILSNFDLGNTLGWALTTEAGTDSNVVVTARVFVSDGTEVTVQQEIAPWHLQFALVALSVGDGANAPIELSVNGLLIATGTTGAGLTFAPAAGIPLVVGNPGPFASSSDVGFMGVAFHNFALSSADLQGFSERFYHTGRLSPSFAAGAPLTFAWDTQSLLAAGTQIKTNSVTNRIPAPGDVWEAVPGSTNENLSRVAPPDTNEMALLNRRLGAYQVVTIAAAV